MAGWEFVAAAIALALVVWRIVGAVRRGATGQQEDWDEKLVRNLRAQSTDPFQPRDFDFFFSLPTAEACEAFATVLKPRGYSVDFKAGGEDSIGLYTLHARKALSISVSAIHETVGELRALAGAHAASYDGWAAAGMLGQKR